MISKTKCNMVFLGSLLLISCVISARPLLLNKDADKNANDTSDTAVSASIDSNDAITDFYLSEGIMPTHYNIYLTIFPERIHYFGEVSVNINIRHDVDAIQLHTANVIFFNPVLSKNGNIYVPTLMKPMSKTWILSFSNGLSRGNYTLSLEFDGTFDADGIFKTSYTTEGGENAWLLASHIPITGARHVFPCWDEPTLRTTFNITIYHSRNYTPLSNMPIREVKVGENDMVWTHFQTTPAIPPYLVGVALHGYLNLSLAENFRCRPQSARYVKFAKTVADNVTMYFRQTWERNLKREEIWVPRIYHVVIPGFSDDSIQNWGLILYREKDIIFDPQIDTVASKIKIIRLVSHALAHQWFGNRVSPSSWFHLWLNEGIASLLGAEIGNKAFPWLRAMDLSVVQMKEESLRLDTSSVMQPLVSNIKSTSSVNSLFSFSYYTKAPVILRMLQHIITDEVFRKGIGVYFDKYNLESASLNNFWTVMQEACLEAQMPSTEEFNLTNIMDSWITKAYYPVLNVTRHNSSYIKISVENPSNLKYSIPLTMTTQANPNFSIPTSLYRNPDWIRKILLDPEVTDYYVPAEEGNWVIVNLQQIGYYRVNYENENWIRLATYLKSENYKKIHVLNRAQIIDDAFYFLMKGQLALSTFVNLVEYLWQETDFVIWYPMFKVFEQISSYFPFEESFYIRETMWTLLEKLLKTYEVFNYDELANCLRHDAIIWLCKLGSSNCKKKANHQLQSHLEPDADFWPGWREWTCCAGLMEANTTTWDTMFYIYINKSNKDILKFLACSENPALIIYYMEIIVSRYYNERMEGYDRVNSFHSIIARHARNNIVLDYMLANFKRLKPREINTFVVLVDIINHVYSNEQLVKIRSFLETNLKETNNLTVTIIHEYFTINIPFDEVNKFRTYIVEYVSNLISFVERKIQLRSLEIEKHRNYFRHLELLRQKLIKLTSSTNCNATDDNYDESILKRDTH